MVQAAEAVEAAAAAVCHVPDSPPETGSPHRQGPAGVAVLPGPTALHCGPLPQLPRLPLVNTQHVTTSPCFCLTSLNILACLW